MSRVLLTAFEAYGRFPNNSSWLTLVELAKSLPDEPRVTTRRYPVDYRLVRERLSEDLAVEYDFVLLMGQNPGATSVELEKFAVNMRGEPDQPREEYQALEPTGPAAFQSGLPLGEWAQAIRAGGVPANVSFHAGTYLCNAALYWTHFLCEQRRITTNATFVHLPLTPEQVATLDAPPPSLPFEQGAKAMQIILAKCAEAT